MLQNDRNLSKYGTRRGYAAYTARRGDGIARHRQMENVGTIRKSRYAFLTLPHYSLIALS